MVALNSFFQSTTGLKLNWVCLLIVCGLFIIGCTQHSYSDNEKLIAESGFVHIVYLNLKDDLSNDQIDFLVKELKRLEEIENVLNFSVGTFEDLGDKRALDEYEIIMQMTFSDRATYDIYQQDPLHSEVKKATGSLLAGPPVTYDFIPR